MAEWTLQLDNISEETLGQKRGWVWRVLNFVMLGLPSIVEWTSERLKRRRYRALRRKRPPTRSRSRSRRAVTKNPVADRSAAGDQTRERTSRRARDSGTFGNLGGAVSNTRPFDPVVLSALYRSADYVPLPLKVDRRKNAANAEEPWITGSPPPIPEERLHYWHKVAREILTRQFQEVGADMVPPAVRLLSTDLGPSAAFVRFCIAFDPNPERQSRGDLRKSISLATRISNILSRQNSGDLQNIDVEPIFRALNANDLAEAERQTRRILKFGSQ